MPVLKMGRHVAGVISEADLLAAEDKAARQARMNAEVHRRWRLRKPQHTSLTVGTMMTSPAITIHPDATIPAAARMMTTHNVSRLPVVDPDGKLIGIVSRRDLLSVFLRPDADILADAGPPSRMDRILNPVAPELTNVSPRARSAPSAWPHGVLAVQPADAFFPRSSPPEATLPLAFIWGQSPRTRGQRKGCCCCRVRRPYS